MPPKLTTTISKISSVPNPTNAKILEEFHRYMKYNGSSEHHQNNNLKVVLSWVRFLGRNTTFYDIQSKEQIIAFLNTKTKTSEEDPEKKGITTWNHYLHRIKLFLRWLTKPCCRSLTEVHSNKINCKSSWSSDVLL